MPAATEELLTRAEVEEICKIKRSLIYKLMRAGGFPLPLWISPKCVRWRSSEVEAWLETRPRAEGEKAEAASVS